MPKFVAFCFERVCATPNKALRSSVRNIAFISTQRSVDVSNLLCQLLVFVSFTSFQFSLHVLRRQPDKRFEPYQIYGLGQLNRSAKKGRTVRTVYVYLSCLSGMMDFTVHNGYIFKSPYTGVDPLRKSKSDPDPLSKEEYRRLLDAAPAEQIRNLWILARNTGLRHGGISALS